MDNLQQELKDLIETLDNKDQRNDHQISHFETSYHEFRSPLLLSDAKDIHDKVTKILQRTRDQIHTLLEQVCQNKSVKKCIVGTKTLLDLMYELLTKPNEHPIIRYRQCKDVFPVILSTGRKVCEMVCRVTSQYIKNFSVADSCLAELPNKLDQILGLMTPETPTDLSGKVDIKGISVENIQQCRNDLHVCCIEFCGSVCDQLKATLREIEKSTIRADEKFKPYLDCVVKQHFYVQRSCALCRELLLSYPEEERNGSSIKTKYKEIFPKIRKLMRQGKRIIVSISEEGEFPSDFEATVIPASTQIRECRALLRKYQKSGAGDLDKALKSVEISCLDICGLLTRGKKCIPPGNLPIGEDISIKCSSDFEKDEDAFKSSDFVGNVTFDENRSDEEISSDSEDFDESDIIIKKMTYAEYKKIDKELSKMEIISIYDIKDLRSTNVIQINPRVKLKCERVQGKIRNGDRWKFAENVEVKNGIISMNAPCGDVLVIYYDFPSGEEKLTKAGLEVDIKQENVSFKISPNSVDGEVTIKYKVYPTDKDRIQGYQEETKEWSHYEISPGLQIESTLPITKLSGETMKMSVPSESPSRDKRGNTFISVTFNKDNENFKKEIIVPDEGRNTLTFQIQKNVVNHVVTVKGRSTPQDSKEKNNLLDSVLNAIKLFLGFKSKCKILTLFQVEQYDDGEPHDGDEQEFRTEMRVECIESQRFLLMRKNDVLARKGWFPLHPCDESSDFTIDENGSILIELYGNITLQPPTRENIGIKYLKNSSCFTKVEIDKKDEKVKRDGYIVYRVNGRDIDWKRIEWGKLFQMYKASTKALKEIGDQFEARLRLYDEREKGRKAWADTRLLMENNSIPEVEKAVPEIYEKLTKSERENLKRILKVDSRSDENLYERITVKVKNDERGRFLFLTGILTKLGRNDLVHELRERAKLRNS